MVNGERYARAGTHPCSESGCLPRSTFPNVSRFYRLENPNTVQISIAEICNCLVHSFVLVPEFSYSPMTGLLLDRLFVSSDRGRYHGVYIFEWRWFVDEFVWTICADDVIDQPSLAMPSGESLYLPSSSAAPVDELARMYCGISEDRRKRYNAFMEKLMTMYCRRPRDWPTRIEKSEVLRRSFTGPRRSFVTTGLEPVDISLYYDPSEPVI